MSKMNDPLELVADLRPAMLDHLADEGYARHRHADLARAAAEGRWHLSPAQRRRRFPAAPGRRRRFVLTGGVAVTAAAAVAVAAAVLGGGPSVSRPQTSSSRAVLRAPLSARRFLLASAVVAAHAPATAGSYWYVRERDFEPSGSATKTRKMFFGATYAATQESWTGPTRSRTIVDENVRFSFASAAGKAKWQAAGKPPLAAAGGLGSTRPETSNYDFGYGSRLGVGGAHLTLAEFRRLPVTAAGLGKALRRMWNRIPDKDKAGVVGLPHSDFYGYLFEWATSVLGGPATPATRAAMYHLLAQQPGIAIVTSVTDPLGRTGVAVADGEGYGGRDYLLIDPQTAQLLAYTAYPVHPNSTISATWGGTEVYEAMGWTNQIGIPAQP
jgi:hypothetical protein